MKRNFGDEEKVKLLAERLENIRGVHEFSDKENKEGWTIATSLSDLEEAFIKLVDRTFIKLNDLNKSDEEIEDILFEMGDEFRHIFYHLKSMKFFETYVS